jgi:hypothetical protein
MATIGVVRPNLTTAAAEAAQARARVEGERMAKESDSTNTKATGQTADLATNAAQQLTDNPRLARLMKLADTHHCKGI